MSQVTYRYFIYIFLLAGIFLATPFASTAQRVTEYATVDSLNVGDTFSYTLILDKSTTYDEINFPDSSQFGSPFEIRSLQRFKVTDFKDSLIYNLQFFGTKDTTISALPVALITGGDTTHVYTKPVPVFFKSVLQAEEKEFRPFKPIFDFAAAWWPYLLALIMMLAAAWYFYKLYKRAQESPEVEPGPEFRPSPFKDPLKQLQKTLKQLQSFTFSTEEDFKQFYINLGDAIRLYFEKLYTIPALELTSREILIELNRRAIDQELIKQTKIVLNEADMVKFAKFTPTKEQAAKALQKGDSFLKKAREIDGPRVDHLRRQHLTEMENAKQSFEQNQQEDSEKI